jgi:hypothetical protein
VRGLLLQVLILVVVVVVVVEMRVMMMWAVVMIEWSDMNCGIMVVGKGFGDSGGGSGMAD